MKQILLALGVFPVLSFSMIVSASAASKAEWPKSIPGAVAKAKTIGALFNCHGAKSKNDKLAKPSVVCKSLTKAEQALAIPAMKFDQSHVRFSSSSAILARTEKTGVYLLNGETFEASRGWSFNELARNVQKRMTMKKVSYSDLLLPQARAEGEARSETVLAISALISIADASDKCEAIANYSFVCKGLLEQRLDAEKLNPGKDMTLNEMKKSVADLDRLVEKMGEMTNTYSDPVKTCPQHVGANIEEAKKNILEQLKACDALTKELKIEVLEAQNAALEQQVQGIEKDLKAMQSDQPVCIGCGGANSGTIEGGNLDENLGGRPGTR